MLRTVRRAAILTALAAAAVPATADAQLTMRGHVAQAGNTQTIKCDLTGVGFVGVGITKCSTDWLSAPGMAIPGPAAVTAAVGTVPLFPSRLCFHGHGITLAGTYEQVSGCTEGGPSSTATVTS